MKAMLFNQIARLSENAAPLVMSDVDEPTPGENEVLIGVTVCGVCHTELDEIGKNVLPRKTPNTRKNKRTPRRARPQKSGAGARRRAN